MPTIPASILNVAIDLVAMPERPSATNSAYCDIQGPEGVTPCLEIDLIEGNTKAVQSTLHTAQGYGADGATCNQDGCAANFGKDSKHAHLYGPGTTTGIDSTRPFTVRASFREGAHGGAIYDVSLTQSSEQSQQHEQQSHHTEGETDRHLHFFNSEAMYGSHVANGPVRAAPVPGGDRVRMRTALSSGMVLVLSLWTADDLSWLDGGCDAAHPKCDIEAARFEVSNFRTSDVPSPPSPPPFPPPALPPSLPPALITETMQLALWAAMLVASIFGGFFVLRRMGMGQQRANGSRTRPRRGRSSAQRMKAVHEEEEDDEDDEEMPTSRI